MQDERSGPSRFSRTGVTGSDVVTHMSSKSATSTYRRSAKARDTKERWLVKNMERARGYYRASRQRMREFIRSLKDVPCMDCHGSFDPVCMDFDHRPGEEKLFGIGSGADVSIEAIRAEAAKCDVVCSNCHRVRTYRQRDHSLTVKNKVTEPTRQLDLLGGDS